MSESPRIRSLLLLLRNPVNLTFGGNCFQIVCDDDRVTVLRDEKNFAVINLKNYQVAYKATILGGFSQSEEVTGEVDYRQYFMLDWQDEQQAPELVLLQNPDEIRRDYKEGQKIELGIEDISGYRVVYRDSVVADFTQTGKDAFEFSFTTGFEGNIWKDSDGTHAIRFKGIRLDAEEDGYNSESKFIISRSRYTDNLVLIMQDDASVYLTP
jgi:hypothetical protein